MEEEAKVVKSDKELIQERIDELTKNIESKKCTGKTYRAINSIIDKLFSNPIGSQIPLEDDPKSSDNEGLHAFINEFTKRMERDFPHMNFKIRYPEPGVATVSRLSETYQETAQRRLKQWQKKINEL